MGIEISLSHRHPRRLRAFFRDGLAVAGLAILATVILAALLAPVLDAHDPTRGNLLLRMKPPSAEYPLGTDPLGRCIFARLLRGARLSLGAASIAAAVTLTTGLLVGLVAGYYRGWVDAVLMRIVDVLLGLPSLILTLAIAGMLGPSLVNVVIALSAVGWVPYARLVRGMVLSTREKEFVESARAAGARDLRILLRHVLPDVLSPVVVLVTLDLGLLILSISSLSFLGIGAQAPSPEWGRMVADGVAYMQFVPGLVLYPGLAIFVTVLGFNLVGDGLRNALDPRGLSVNS